jgi:hypothetical protein
MAKPFLLLSFFLFVFFSGHAKIVYCQFCGNDCVKPWAPPDRWDDADTDGVYDPGEFYDPWLTGYKLPDDVGIQIVLKLGSSHSWPLAVWYYAACYPPTNKGNPNAGTYWYREYIWSCEPYMIDIGDQLQIEPGIMVGATNQGLDSLINTDPNAMWDTATNTVINSAYPISPRIVKVSVFDPTLGVQTDPFGRHYVTVVKIILVFVEGHSGVDVVGRFMGLVSQDRRVDLFSGPDQTGRAEKDVSFQFYVINPCVSPDTFDLDITDSLGWTIAPTHHEVSLDPGQVDTVNFMVSIPYVQTGTVDRITLTATSQADSFIYAKASLIVTVVSPRIIYVPGEQPTIQAGINEARNGDTVLVARGHYYESINFYGKAILVASNFIFDNLTATIDSTIIDADTSVLGVSDTASIVVFVSQEDSNSAIKGFTIQNGIGTLDQYGNRLGGGIYCFNSSPTIRNNIIISNSASFGGGVHCYQNSSPIINNNTMRANSASLGGAIYCDWSSSPTVDNNRITENSANDGGGIFLGIGCLPIIRNNTIDKNSSYWAGGGIMCDYNASPAITNNIISNSLDGKGIDCMDEAWPTISYNDFWNNADGNFRGGQPGLGDTTWGTNYNGTPCDTFYNIIRDPFFADSINYSLTCSSACIDAGKPSYKVPDKGGRRIDIGLFEYPYLIGDANGLGNITLADVIYIANYLLKAGPKSCPLGASDIDCSGKIELPDVIYLANYLLKGGPSPCGPK